LLPPSITVSVVVNKFKVAVTGIVTGEVPQLKVMTPPFATAELSELSVQLAAVPLPTTVVGCETFAGCASSALVQAVVPER